VLSETPLVIDVGDDGDNVTAVLNQFVAKDPASASVRRSG
jgi:hypothetical protein